jgi:UTP--glucose-1-phosphate uridylyltransferase
MKITKAVITAAAPYQRGLPLQSLIDRDGKDKTALRIIVEEALAAGASDVCVVVHPGDQAAYAAAVGPHARHLTFVEQARPLGYGDAVLRARAFVADDPFVHLVSDHLHVSAHALGHSCALQAVQLAEAEDCAVSAVQRTRESALPHYGAVGGKRDRHERAYAIERVLEKPTPTEAEQHLIVPGLRAGYYLCFFGIHVLTPAFMDVLTDLAARAPDARPDFAHALNELAGRERYLAYEIEGVRYDIGARYGWLNAQLALALDGDERADVLAQLVELLATRSS